MNIGSLEVLLGVNTAGLSRAAVNMRRFESQVIGSNQRMQASFEMLGSKMMLTGTLLTQYFTVPLALLAGAGVKTFASFETELGKMAALTSFTTEQIKGMANEILQLTSKVGRSPKELAQGLYFIGSSGIKDSALAMDILGKASNASRIGLGETKVVADALTSVINAYGKEAITAGRATDIMVAAVREGKGEADALTRVFGHVMPLAVQLGVGFDQVAGSLATLTLSGKSASEASTQLARLFTTLIQTPPRSEAALEKFGISFKKLRKDLKDGGMVKLMESLKEMIGGNTLDVIQNSKAYEDNITVLGDVFTNIRALLPVLDMIGPNFENLKRVLDATKNSSNSLSDGIKDVAGTVGDKWNRAMGGLTASLIKFGDVLKGPVMQLIQKFAGFVNDLADKFARLPSATQKNIIMFGALAVVAGPLLLILGQIVEILKTFFTILLGSSMMSVVTQFLLLAAAIYYTYKNWDMFVQAVKDFSWDRMMQGISEGLFKLVSASPEKVQKEWERYAQTLQNVEDINKTIQSTANALPKDLGALEQYNTVEKIQSKILEKQKEYQSLMVQMPKITESTKLYDTYGKIILDLEDIYQLKLRIIEADKLASRSKDPSVSKMDAIMRQRQADSERTVLLLAAKDVVNAFEKQKSGLVSFGDLGNKILSDIGNDVTSLAKKILNLDLSKGYGVSEVLDRSGDVYNKMPALAKKPQQLMPMFDMKVVTAELNDMTSKTDKFRTLIDMIIESTNDELQVNNNVAKVLGSNYKKAETSATILNNALEQLTQPEMVKIMTPEQLEAVKQYLAMLDQVNAKQQDNIKLLDAWRSLFRDIASLASLIGKYMGEEFQKAFQVISDIISGIGTFIRIIKDILAITKLTVAAEAAKTAVTAAGIPVTLAAAAAETTKAAASTEAAVAGAASSTSWIPIVGVALAVAGVAAILIALGSHKSKATGMYNGGMVPSGFPNDSFPAMLTSGETVIPLSKLGNFAGSGQEITVKVEGVAKGTDIHYIVKEVERRLRNSN